MKRWIGIAAFVLVLLHFSGGSAWKLYAQATTGYTKLNTTAITSTSFTFPVTDATTYNVEVTAVNAAGESGPSVIVTGTSPASGTHTGLLSWTASAGAVSYNVYDQIVTIPNPPGAPQLIFN